ITTVGMSSAATLNGMTEPSISTAVTSSPAMAVTRLTFSDEVDGSLCRLLNICNSSCSQKGSNPSLRTRLQPKTKNPLDGANSLRCDGERNSWHNRLTQPFAICDPLPRAAN